MTKRVQVLLGVLLALSGCHVTRGYSGPARSSAETALLYPQGVILRQVNTHEVGGLSRAVEVLPGETDILLSIDPSNYNDLTRPGQVYRLKMRAEAGASYIISSNKYDGQPCAWEMVRDSGQPDYSKPLGCAVREK